jgi:hypothetical protein
MSQFDRLDSNITIKVADGLRPKEQSVIRAVVPGEAGLSPVQGEALQFQQSPLLFLKDGHLVVDAAKFSDITCVDGTRIAHQPQDRVKVCTAKPEALEMTDHQLLRFLLESEAILTYAHAEAESKLTHESEDGSIRSLHITTQHVYYTNERNAAVYSFRVDIHSKTGEIYVAKSVVETK